MKKLTLLTIILILFSLTTHLHAMEIMKLSEIKTGMEGEGKTIFKGTKIETFTFKVLGIIENFAPTKNLIIVELNAPQLNSGGIVSGMSGSPAYIDGKLIGAVAYGFAFTRTPIGGITPIEDILQTIDYNTPTFSIDMSTISIEFDKKNVTRIAKRIQEELEKRLSFAPSGAFTPIHLMGTTRGIKPSSLSYMPALQPLLSLSGGTAVSAVSTLDAASGEPTGHPAPSGQETKETAIPTIYSDKNLGNDILKMSPADAVAIPLLTGDFEISASGTVTHVDGDNIYMFGHPFFNIGTCDLPMHKAEVISVVPSYQESFRLVATKQMVGHIVQDRFSAVQGELGKIPYMIPIKVFLKNRNKQFNMQVANHPLLTPNLAAFTLYNIFSSQYQQVGFQSIKVDGKIFIEGEKNIVIDDMFSGTDSYLDFSNLLMVITYFLMNNNEKTIKIQKMDFEIRGSETLRRANLESVLMEKNSFLPGEIMNVTVNLRNERGNAFSETVGLQAPNMKAGSEFYVLVADNEEMGDFDSKNIRTSFFPIKLSFLIRAINNLRKNNRLYFRLLTPEEGLFVKGHEYPNLPASLQRVFDYNSAPLHGITPTDQSAIKYSTIREYQLEFPNVVRGRQLFKLKIKERSNDQ